MAKKWTQDDIPDLSGKVIVITGANSGLGLESSRALAGKGATVVMAVRTPSKGESAKSDILKSTPKGTLDVMQCDMADLSSVRAFADAFKAKYDRLDVLCNNAGLMAIPYQKTADGFEMQLGVNHLGHFALTAHLLDILLKTPKSRIHNVTSTANFFGHINFDDLNSEQNYSRWGAYSQSKLANVFFTFELQKRLSAAGADTIANVSHPGLVYGQLQENSMGKSGTGGSEIWMYRIMRPLLSQDISMGILPMLYAMTAPDAKGGAFYGPRWFQHHGYPDEKKANKKAYNADAIKRFWQVSEELTGVTYDFKTAAV